MGRRHPEADDDVEISCECMPRVAGAGGLRQQGEEDDHRESPTRPGTARVARGRIAGDDDQGVPTWLRHLLIAAAAALTGSERPPLRH